jgi:hypothetical protein
MSALAALAIKHVNVNNAGTPPSRLLFFAMYIKEHLQVSPEYFSSLGRRSSNLLQPQQRLAQQKPVFFKVTVHFSQSESVRCSHCIIAM